MNPYFTQPLHWQAGSGDHIYQCWHAGQTWQITLGDFPAQALYTLWIDGQRIAGFDDWPLLWARPERG